MAKASDSRLFSATPGHSARLFEQNRPTEDIFLYGPSLLAHQISDNRGGFEAGARQDDNRIFVGLDTAGGS